DNKTDYIKRIVGMPGDDVQMIRGVLHINDEPVQRRLVGEFKNWRCDGTVLPRVPIYEETLPNGHTYRTLDAFQRLPLDNTPKVTVKEGHYFMMGDNRDCSQDSRAPFVGQVPFENMVGKAEILFFSINSEKFGIRFGRIFNLIR
ncbi:MAG: signal peptidase I, partial [Pseudomonadota bacterium]